MSNFKHTISRILTSTTAAAALLMATASCSMMHDNLDECTRELRVTFSYDMNMKFADAFPSQVKTVTLYAYDAQGKLAMQKTESTDDIKARGGYMELDGMEPGKYTLKVWAEGEQRHADSYTYGQPTSESQAISVLDSRINRSTRNVDHDLTALYHGLVTEADLGSDGEYGVKTVNVPLTKDTNVVRVVLQNTSGATLNAEDFDFSIDDDNSWLAYDNSPVKSDSITYNAWSTTGGLVGEAGNEGNQVSAVVAEMTVNRLLRGAKGTAEPSKNPRLKVRNVKTGKTVFNVPLIDYALLVKGNYNHAMSDQEYLDRQDEYNFIFFLDRQGNWASSSIYVESWRIVLSNVSM